MQIYPKRSVKEILKQRKKYPTGDPLWLLYNSELRFTQAYNADPDSLDTMAWRHIYYHNLKLFSPKKTNHLKPVWNLLPMPDPLPGLDPITSAILINRNITNYNEFIEAPLENISLSMDGLEKASSLIIRAINKEIPITIYGDYDADGITGTALAVEALSRLNAKVDFYINNRTKGYAINTAGIREIASRGAPRLIITIDNGISAIEAVNLAREMKMAVIITDHHEIIKRPNAHAIVHPEKFNTPLAGVGTIFKLMHYLYKELNRDGCFDFLDLVAIGTIADVVPLIGENRILTKHGIIRMNTQPRPAIQALMQIMNIKEINSESIAYKIAPVINALSRMNGSPDQAVEFLLSQNLGQAMPTAKYLIDLNDKRKELVDIQFQKAEQMADPESKIIIISSNFHEGIAGIIAGKLKEKYNRPVVILSENEEYLKGSCRSTDDFNIKKALDNCPELVSYGGHPKAAGLLLKKKDFGLFCRSLVNQAADLIIKPPVINIDAELDEINPELVQAINSLEPYGEAFPAPLFTTKCKVEQIKEIGNNHLKILGKINYIIWNAYKDIADRKPGQLELLGTPSIDDYNGSLQFIAREYKELKA